MTHSITRLVRYAVIITCAFAPAACGAPQPASSASQPVQEANMSSTKIVLDRHMKTFGSQDLEGVLADYATDAVMFTPQGPVKGIAALRSTFETLFTEWGKPGVTFELKQQTVDGNHAYIFWNAQTPDNAYEAGSDSFVVVNGKIVAHFFSAKITPKSAKK
jgi:ketosteroid isomerase-like protein